MDIRRPDIQRRKLRRWFAAGAIAAGFLLLVGVAVALSSRPPAVDGDGLWYGAVTRGELVHEVSAGGTLIAPELRAVTNRSEGVVEQILVLPGQAVGPQDVLAELSSPQLEDELADARAELEAALAERVLLDVELEKEHAELMLQLSTAEADYKIARLELDAEEALGDQGTTSALEIERHRVQVEQLQKTLLAVESQVDRFTKYRDAREAVADTDLSLMREAVERSAERVKELKVRAGISGVVQEVDVEEGQRLSAGTEVARIVNPEHLIARVAVSERDAAQVRLGLPVRLEMGRETIAGRVIRLDPTVRDRLVTVDVELSDGSTASLRPDLSVTARIELERIEDALILDRPVGLRDGNETLELFRLVDDARAERVTVEVGRASARQVEIVSGLEPGDRVILPDMSDWIGEPVIRIR